MRTTIAASALLAFLAPLFAGAQPAQRVYRIGWLYQGEAPIVLPKPYLDQLRTLGYVEGTNLVIESRNAKTDAELPSLAAELAAQRVDLIYTIGTPATRAAKQATSTIPIFFSVAADPVKSGLVSSYARPGGNVTGVAGGLFEDKMLETLKQAMPGLTRVACLCDGMSESAASAARKLGLQIFHIDTRSHDDFGRFFAAARDMGAQAALIQDIARFIPNRAQLGELSARARLPSIGISRDFTRGGGLLAYEASLTGRWVLSMTLIDKILKGANPGDMPIVQTMYIRLLINLKTANELGLTIPASLLLQAEEILR